MVWPRGPTQWIEGRTLYVSVPFTWDLPSVRVLLRQRAWYWDNAIVGGPAVRLMPEYLADEPSTTIGDNMPGVLQRVNPEATRTTLGCPRRCAFCGVNRIEPKFVELEDWPDLPVLCDNNILAASMQHYHRVLDRLVRHGRADFNQGIDARLLTMEHAKRIAEIGKPIVRLALDDMRYATQWERAFDTLRKAGLAKSRIRSYAVVGFDSGPTEAWQRCEWVASHGIKVLPMWFHSLDQMQANIVTHKQAALGWSEAERLRLMGWYYKHRGSPLVADNVEGA